MKKMMIFISHTSYRTRKGAKKIDEVIRAPSNYFPKITSKATAEKTSLHYRTFLNTTV